MELAYRCRDAPQQFEGKVEVDEDGTFILVYTDRGRVRIPLQVGGLGFGFASWLG